MKIEIFLDQIIVTDNFQIIIKVEAITNSNFGNNNNNYRNNNGQYNRRNNRSESSVSAVSVSESETTSATREQENDSGRVKKSGNPCAIKLYRASAHI